MAVQEKWYFTREQLLNSPSRKCGVDPDKELAYRQQAASLIQDMGQKLQVTQLCINTAIVYMHRFYAFHSFTQFHRNSIASAALFLAAKVEEQPRKLEYVIKMAHICLHRQDSLDVRSEHYQELAQDLVFNENVLLQTLGFDVAIDHPHTHVVRTCHLVKAPKDLAQTSYFMASNSLHLTSFCLQYKPTVVACFCIHLASKWSNWAIPQSNEGRQWFSYVDKSVTLDLLEKLTGEFLRIFEKCPARLKRKMMSMSNNLSDAAGGTQQSSGNSQGDKKNQMQDDGSFDREYEREKRRTLPAGGYIPATGSLPPPQSQPPPSKIDFREYREKKDREERERRQQQGSSSSSSNNQHRRPPAPQQSRPNQPPGGSQAIPPHKPPPAYPGHHKQPHHHQPSRHQPRPAEQQAQPPQRTRPPSLFSPENATAPTAAAAAPRRPPQPPVQRKPPPHYPPPSASQQQQQQVPPQPAASQAPPQLPQQQQHLQRIPPVQNIPQQSRKRPAETPAQMVQAMRPPDPISPLSSPPPKKSSRPRTSSSSSEPELIPVVKKLDDTPGYEKLIRDSKRASYSAPSNSNSHAGHTKPRVEQPLNGIETDPALVSSLLKESLTGAPPPITVASENSQQQPTMPTIQPIEPVQEHTRHKSAQPPVQAPLPSQAVPMEDDHRHKSEKKKKKEKHKHKSKEERKKHKKDKDRSKHREETASAPAPVLHSQTVQQPMHLTPNAGLKIKIPKERLAAPPPAPGLKIKIPKEVLESSRKGQFQHNGHTAHKEDHDGRTHSSQ